MTACGPTFAHLDSLTDRFGTFEHARYAQARLEHGYCTDDVARVLVVTLRESDPSPEVCALTSNAFRFVAEAQGVTGNTRNRRAANGRWHGPRTVEDCWGRSLWAFGVAVETRADSLGDDALAYFERGAERRSPWPRSMAYAALGAAAVLAGASTATRSASALLVGRRRPDRATGRRRVVALARAPSHLRQRAAAGCAARRRLGSRASRADRRRLAPLGVAARSRDRRRAPVGDPRRRVADRVMRTASTSNRSRWRPSPRRAPAPSRSPEMPVGQRVCVAQRHGSMVTTTPAPGCGTPRRAAATTGSRRPGSTSIKAPSRRSR